MPKAAGKKDDPKGKKGVMDKPKNQSGSKPKKKKWSKVKTKDKLNHSVLLDQASYDRLCNDICKKSKMITPAIVAERLKVTLSIARRALRELEQNGAIKLVGDRHHSLNIYTNTAASKA
jgi:small subunit ribosomal protein S25e